MRKLSLLLAMLLAISIIGSSATYAATTPHPETVLVKKTGGKKKHKKHKKTKKHHRKHKKHKATTAPK